MLLVNTNSTLYVPYYIVTFVFNLKKRNLALFKILFQKCHSQITVKHAVALTTKGSKQFRKPESQLGAVLSTVEARASQSFKRVTHKRGFDDIKDKITPRKLPRKDSKG